MNITILIAALLLGVLSSISAQDSTNSIVKYTTDSILVESTRYSLHLTEAPFSIDFIDLKTIQSYYNPNSLEDILNSQAGIFVNNRNNLSQGDKITIRGIGARSQFGIRSIKIFLDGIPLTFTDGQSQLNNLDVDDIGNIEILKGPSSVLYGNALGGVILITSKKELNSRYNIKPKVIIGSFGFSKINLNTSLNFNENFRARLNVYSSKQDGFREHSTAKYYGMNFISNYRVSDKFNLSLVSNYFYSPYLLNPSTLNKIDSKSNPLTVRFSVYKFGLGKKVDQLQSGIILNYYFNTNSKIKSTIYFASRTLKNSIPGRFIKLDRLFGGIRTELNHKTNFLDNELVIALGIDFENQLDRRKEYKNEGFNKLNSIEPNKLLSEINFTDILINQNESVKSLGMFYHLQYKLTKNLSLFTGIRFDDYLFNVKNNLKAKPDNLKNNIEMNNLSYMFGYNFRISNNLNIYGNYSYGFQTPTINELSNNPVEEGGFNENLIPEKVKNIELGIKGWIEKFNMYSTLSIFYMNFYDMLVSYESPQEITYYRNVGKANNIGTDLKLEYLASENFKVFSSFSLLHFRFSDYVITQVIENSTKNLQLKNKYLPGVPKYRAFLSVQNYFTNNFYMGVNVNWVDQYYTNDYNGALPGTELGKSNYINESYLKVDLSSNFTINYKQYSIKINLEVKNIFNKRYNGSIVPNAFGGNFFEPAPGRNYLIGMEMVL